MQYKLLSPGEIISTADFEFVVRFLKDTGRTQVGWHYVIDLAWMYSQAKNWPANYRVLDAGGGRGPTQFLLAELGFDVTNVDLVISEPAAAINKRYRMRFETAASLQKTSYVDFLHGGTSRSGLPKKIGRILHRFGPYQEFVSRRYEKTHQCWRDAGGIREPVGSLTWIQANLCNVPEIEANSYDAVLSLSALEHIPMDALPDAWAEINRICKPEAKFAVTTSATEQLESWYHEPSQSYCFTEGDLEKLFAARAAASSLSPQLVLDEYRACSYLKEHLASFYFESGSNGMPWGEWNPLYIPVGIFR